MIVRRLARPLLASIFIFGGIGALRHTEGHRPAAEKVTKKVSELTSIPEDTDLQIKVNGAAMLGGGLLLATGKAPRVASLVLIGSLVPTTATHDFWNETDPAAKQMQQVQFVKNLSLIGGLLLAAVDTAGKPGLGYRAKLAGDSIGRGTKTARREAKIAALQAKSAVS